MIVSILNANGHALGEVRGSRVKQLSLLKVGDRLSLRIGDDKVPREYEVIGRSELHYLGGASLVLDGKTVLSNTTHEHKLTLTVAPARKRRRS